MTELDLAQIRTDGGTQPRAMIDPDLVEDYAEAMKDGAKFPPVVVYYDGESYWLADGFHRLNAHLKLGRKRIEAEIRSGTVRDAILCAVGANASHGKRRSLDDKRRAVEQLLRDEEWGQWSDREIACRCAVTHPFVGKIRQLLPPPPKPGASGNVSRCAQSDAPPEEPRRKAIRKGKVIEQRLKKKRKEKLTVTLVPTPKESPPTEPPAESEEPKEETKEQTARPSPSGKLIGITHSLLGFDDPKLLDLLKSLVETLQGDGRGYIEAIMRLSADELAEFARAVDGRADHVASHRPKKSKLAGTHHVTEPELMEAVEGFEALRAAVTQLLERCRSFGGMAKLLRTWHMEKRWDFCDKLGNLSRWARLQADTLKHGAAIEPTLPPQSLPPNGRKITFTGRTFYCPYEDAIRPPALEWMRELKASIIKNKAVKEPVLVDQHDNVIDGVLRLDLAREIGLTLDYVPITDREVASPEEAIALRRKLNPERCVKSK